MSVANKREALLDHVSGAAQPGVAAASGPRGNALNGATLGPLAAERQAVGPT